jgi:hypothetical protein
MNLCKKLGVLFIAAALLFVFAACEPAGVRTYDISSGSGISSARVFYPDTIDQLSNVGATTVSGGFSNSKEDMYWLATEIAKAGMIAIAISASSNTSVSGYERAHRGGLDLLRSENTRTGSPIRGKVGSLGLAGYSMGGGAVINVSSALGTQVGTCMAMAPYNPSPRSTHRAATMILTGSSDLTAPPRVGLGAYNNLPSGVPKLYASMRGQGHLYWVNLRNPGSETEFMQAWMKYYLENNQTAYSIFSNGPGSGMTDYRFDPATGGGGGGCN